MTAPECPTDDALAALALGTLPPPELDALAAHLDGCARCAARAGEMDALTDGVTAGVRRAADLTGLYGPRVLGGYELLARVGGGGMGTVYKARHSRLGHVVALKVMAADARTWPNAAERFAREARLGAGIVHPNLVTVRDAGEADGVPFLVTDWIDGTDLTRLVREGGALPPAEAARCARHAAAGLAHLHARGVLHRDVKPANLMRDTLGTVRVLDLGLARDAEPDGDGALTGSDAVIGSRDYMAPEVAAGSRRADARADVFGLGATLFFLLTGRPPRGEVSPRAARPDVPTWLDAACRDMLAFDPARRTPTMSAALATLHPARAPVRRVALVAGATLALASVLLLTRPQAVPPPPARHAPLDERMRAANPGFGGSVRIDADGRLKLTGPTIADLSPLSGTLLRELSVRNTAVRSLEPLRGMRLDRLDCTGTRVSDLSPLAGMPLDRLDVYATPVADLSPLRGMRLRELNCASTHVSDLAPLAGMPMEKLTCDTTAVADLSPLTGMPLRSLRFDRTAVRDIAVLKTLRLRKLWCDPDLAEGARLPLLEELNGKPVR